MVQVFSQAGVGDGARLASFDGDDGIGRLEEEERWLPAGKTHFLGVFFVVAAHAINAVHGEAGLKAVDRNRHHGRWCDDKVL